MRFICCMLLLVPLANAQTSSQTSSSTRTLGSAHTSQSIGAAPALAPTASQIAHMKKIRMDWPQLARYRAANAALSPSVPGQDRVVFMGDSITDMWGRRDDMWGRTAGAFFPGKPYINRGISGQTTPQMLVRFWPDVVALHPKAVVILGGTNDIAGNTGPSTPQMIEDNLMAMADLARANHIRVVLASILPAASYPWRPGLDPVEEIRALNKWMRDTCASRDCVYLDYYSAMTTPDGAMKKSLTLDGVHPNRAGYDAMAPLAEKAISAALASK